MQRAESEVKCARQIFTNVARSNMASPSRSINANATLLKETHGIMLVVLLQCGNTIGQLTHQETLQAHGTRGTRALAEANLALRPSCPIPTAWPQPALAANPFNQGAPIAQRAQARLAMIQPCRHFASFCLAMLAPQTNHVNNH